MKKTVIWIVIAVLIAALAVGAWMWYQHFKNKQPNASDNQDGDFQMWADQATITVKRGERGEILVHLKNNTGGDYSYQGSYYSFHPPAR